jgi:hypothetical protein
MTIWNWKAGVLSAVYRAPIFLLTSLRAGWQAALTAMLTETAFRVVTSGFYGAFVESIRKLEPAWLAVLIVLLIAPAAVQVLEFAVHVFSGTSNVKTGVLVSTAMTAVASLFNWYSMRQGALLTGENAPSFWSDLKRFPVLIFGFMMAIPKAIAERLRPAENRKPGDA